MSKLFKVILSAVLGFSLGFALPALAATQYGAGSLLQIGDVQSKHILNGTILNEDISSAAAITLQKLYTGVTHGNLFFDSYGEFGTSTAIKVSTTTPALYVLGGSIEATTTNFNGVPYTWPSSSGSSGQFLKSDGAGSLSWDTAASSVVTRSFTAGEAITAGDAVAVGGFGTSAIITNSSTASTQNQGGTTYYLAQRIALPASATSITQITVRENRGGVDGNSVSMAAYIYADDGAGLPTGSSLGSFSGSCTYSSAACTATLTGTAISVTGGTNYVIEFRNTGGYAGNTYTGNSAGQYTSYSTNSGSSWTSVNGPVYTTVTGTSGVAGKVYRASSADTGWRNAGYIGIAENTVATDASVAVDMFGVSTATSTLTAGNTYYLNDTNGTIGKSAGSNSKKIGEAISSNELLLVFPPL